MKEDINKGKNNTDNLKFSWTFEWQTKIWKYKARQKHSHDPGERLHKYYISENYKKLHFIKQDINKGDTQKTISNLAKHGMKSQSVRPKQEDNPVECHKNPS